MYFVLLQVFYTFIAKFVEPGRRFVLKMDSGARGSDVRESFIDPKESRTMDTVLYRHSLFKK